MLVRSIYVCKVLLKDAYHLAHMDGSLFPNPYDKTSLKHIYNLPYGNIPLCFSLSSIHHNLREVASSYTYLTFIFSLDNMYPSHNYRHAIYLDSLTYAFHIGSIDIKNS